IGPTVREARELAASTSTWIRHDTGEPDGYEAVVASAAPDEPVDEIGPASPVLQMYTAAFSGRPNGALLSHTAIIVQALMMARLQEIDWAYVYLNSGPRFHVATWMTTSTPKATRSPLVRSARSSPGARRS